MFIATFPTSAWQSNCYLIGAREGGECVVVDPGPDAADVVARSVQQAGATPVAVLLTHGHIDHVADAAAVCERFGIPAWVHPGDRAMVGEPLLGLGEQFAPMLLQLAGTTTLPVPPDLRDLATGDALELAGLTFDLLHAPGHTPGCMLLRFTGDDRELCLTGDVLFAGSIGRTDLLGGDHEQMLSSLGRLAAWLPSSAVVLPGHGPATTMEREFASNPYLHPF